MATWSHPIENRNIASKTLGKKHYRVLRVRVTNIGGEPLYNLRVQLKLTCHYSYDDIDLTLKDEDLPIIQGHLIRRDQGILPKPRTSFNLHRGEQQFVNVIMQLNENGPWTPNTELCLSAIGSDNYGNHIYMKEPIEFSIIVLGGIHPPYSKPFVMFLDESGILCMKEAT